MKYESYIKRVQKLILEEARYMEIDYKITEDYKNEVKNALTPFSFLRGLYCLTYEENYHERIDTFEEYADMLSVPRSYVESSDLKSAEKIYKAWRKTQ